MARLIVEATSGRQSAASPGTQISSLETAVSVSRADDGSPVTGLTQQNFRASWMWGDPYDIAVMGDFTELKWEPDDQEGSGLYRLSFTVQYDLGAYPGARYYLCVQVRTFQDGLVVDQGQGLAVIVPVPPGD